MGFAVTSASGGTGSTASSSMSRVTSVKAGNVNWQYASTNEWTEVAAPPSYFSLACVPALRAHALVARRAVFTH